MSHLPLLSQHQHHQQQHMNPYEKQISSVRKSNHLRQMRQSKKQEKSYYSRNYNSNKKQVILEPLHALKAEDKNKYDGMSFREKMDRALDAYNNENTDNTHPSIMKRIADEYGLNWKVLRCNVDFMQRDRIFFQHYSIDCNIDDFNDFLYQPTRYFLVTGSPQAFCESWGMSTYADDMESSETGGLPKKFILELCKEWICTLESNTFLSLTHEKTKAGILKKSTELLNRNAKCTPRKTPWNSDTLSSLCSLYVIVYEHNVPPNVLLTKITKNKKANIHKCPFAFVLFDKYLLIQFPNYFQLMLSTVEDPLKIGTLLHKYTEYHDKVVSKIVNLIRINELTSPIKKSYESLEKEVH